MTQPPPCKGCNIRADLTEDEVQELLESYLRAHRQAALVDDAEYLRRLDTCRRCSSLKFATTCGFCGCLVQVRAKLASRHCPDPRGARW